MPLKEDALLRDLVSILSNEERQQQLGQWAASYIFTHHHAGSMISDALHAYSAAKKRCLPPVIICGYYGFENMGDEAVLSHLLTMLRRDGYTNITVLSATSSSTARKHGVAACGRLSFAALRQAGRQGGILLLGGGNLLQNETSSRSLFYYTHVLRYAKQCGCRTWVIGGIGRLSPQGEARVRRSLREVEGCLARTPQDLSYFRKLCPAQAHLQLLPDGALWTQAAKALPYHLPQEEVILLALHGETKETQALIHTCATVAQHEGLLLVLACMHPAQDTAPAQRALASLPHARILPPLSPDVMVAWLKAYGRLVVATRLHALIFSAVAGVPAVTLADGGKLSAFAAYAASCDTPNAPMLTCLREKQEPVEAVRHALHAPRTKEQKRRFLSALRAPGEGFAFSAILHEKTKQHQ
jgi:polysaccharide pyruvyl transferase CsaB